MTAPLLERMATALRELHDDIQDRQDDGANFNPGTLHALGRAHAMLAEFDALPSRSEGQGAASIFGMPVKVDPNLPPEVEFRLDPPPPQPAEGDGTAGPRLSNDIVRSLLDEAVNGSGPWDGLRDQTITDLVLDLADARGLPIPGPDAAPPSPPAPAQAPEREPVICKDCGKPLPLGLCRCTTGAPHCGNCGHAPAPAQEEGKGERDA